MTPDIERLFADAVSAHQQGNLKTAEALYRRIQEHAPRHPDSLHLLGLVAYQTGRLDLAHQLIGQAIAANVGAAPYNCSLGTVLRALGRPAEALEAFRKALQLDCSLAEASGNLANLLLAEGQSIAAEQAYRRVLANDPVDGDAWNSLGYLLRTIERQQAAAFCFVRAVRLRPDDVDSLHNLANSLRETPRIDRACAIFRHALVRQPDFVPSLAKLGEVTVAGGGLEEAVTLGRRAWRIEPNHPDRKETLGLVLHDTGHLDDSIAWFRQTLCDAPASASPLHWLGRSLLEIGDTGQAFAHLRRALDLDPAFAAARRTFATCCLYGEGKDEDTQRALSFAPQTSIALPACSVEGDRQNISKKLVIGYVSSDFMDHPVSLSMYPVFRHHNRTEFSIRIYSDVKRPDRITEAFRQQVDGWCDVTGLSDAEVAARIRADGVDIMVILAGHFDLNRPYLAAFRAAPVQVSLHDVASSGVADMDYIVGDRWLLPPHMREPFTERRLRLPRFYLGQPPITFPEISDDKIASAPVFGCFNNPSKIGTPVLHLWGRILAARPDAILLLKFLDRYASEAVRQRILHGLTTAGAVPQQVVFAQGKESLTVFLDRYNGVDVALDTWPFSGSTTSFQALAMGVPVVTWPQDRMVSRWTEGLLRTLDLDELIAQSGEDYVAIALRLAEERAEWRPRRAALRALLEQRLCNAERWTRHLERLFKAVRHRPGRATGMASGSAVDPLRRLIHSPDDAEACASLGIWRYRTGNSIQAASAFLWALRLDPCSPTASQGLGKILRLHNKLPEARAVLTRALVGDPARGEILGGLSQTWHDEGCPARAAGVLARVLAIQPANRSALEQMIYYSIYRDDLTGDAIDNWHRQFGAAAGRAILAAQPPGCLPSPRRLRIGYLSSDFCNHPVGKAMMPVLQQHDREHFEIFIYSNTIKRDAVTELAQLTADHWCDTGGMDDATLVDQIRTDGIQILVCLAGRFDNNRLQIAAYRAAPVQVSLHDVATSGLVEMDYIIGGRWLLRRHSKEYFSERRLRLPWFYLGTLPKEFPDLDVADHTGSPVFACFNNPSKFSGTAFQLWGRILAARPDSRLMLKYQSRYATPSVRQRVETALVAAGAAKDQLMFDTLDEVEQPFLARYNDIDVALDTLPFSGSTTSFQALLMGVPVVTWPQERMVSRWTAAMLQKLGLPDPIAGSADEYVEVALRLIEQRTHWRSRRGDIRRLVVERLCDNAQRWTRHLERLYKAAWRRHQAGCRDQRQILVQAESKT